MSDAARAAELNATERRVLDAVDEQWLRQTLAELVAIPSVGGAEDAAQEAVAHRLDAMGMDVDTWDMDLPALLGHPAASHEVPRSALRGVAGRTGGSGRSLLINGHVDVVPPGDPQRWSVDPWSATLRNGRIYGRGTCDTKGGLAAALAATRAVTTAGLSLGGALLVTSVGAEEDGGLGTLGTLLRGHRADAAVVVEPTGLQIAPVQAGALGFRLTISGKAAHGALRTSGVSAIDKLAPVLAALTRLEEERNAAFAHPAFAAHDLPLALSVGTLRAGDWPSTVADTLVAEGRYGIAPGEDVASARTAFAQAVAAAVAADPWLAKHPPRIEWVGGQFAAAETPADAPIVAALQACLADVSEAPAAVAGVPYGSDLRLLVNEGGIPGVLYGPGEMAQAHQTDEFVPVWQLLVAARSLALLIVRWCGAS